MILRLGYQESRIEHDIKDICNKFDKLPVINNSGIKTYDKIPSSSKVIHNSISWSLNHFDNDESARNKLIQELKKAFKDAQIKRIEADIKNHEGIASFKVIHDIWRYTNPKFKNQLSEHKKFPAGLFNNPNGIPAIVLSYLKNGLLQGYTWDIPPIILCYMMEYNILSNNNEQAGND